MTNIENTMLRIKKCIKEKFIFLFLLCIGCTFLSTVLTGVTKISNVVDIVDGSSKCSVYTVHDNAKDILAQEEIFLGENDTCSFTGFEDGKATLTIHRAFDVSITADGKTDIVVVSNHTVRQALEKAGVTVGEVDKVTPELDEIVKNGDSITVNRVTYEEYQETQEIPYGSEGIDRELYANERKVVVTAGVNGEKVTTYRKLYLDGTYSETIVVADKVTKMPVNEVLKIEEVEQTSSTTTQNKQSSTSSSSSQTSSTVSGSESDIDLLARVVSREIGGGSSLHKQMVAEVILNRVRSPLFPNTIRGVIEQAGQFDNVENYWTQRPPEQSTYDAVKKAMAGSNVANGALYFYAPAWTSSANAKWFETSLTFITEIEGHRFFK